MHTIYSEPAFDAVTQCDQLILESLNINYIDESEYPSTTDIQNKCAAALQTCFQGLLISILSPAHDMMPAVTGWKGSSLWCAKCNWLPDFFLECRLVCSCS